MRVLVYGMARTRVAELVRAHGGPDTTVRAVSDYEAAMNLRAGRVDLGIGVCQSGAGGALAVARALLGTHLCLQVSSPSRPPQEEEIRRAVKEGRKAFGIALSHIEIAVPLIMAAAGEAHSQKSAAAS
ncbi:MAG TPA: DUF2620 family protein [Candidatus Limnocylindrales bacterium]|nr:DUF2620 family protein [Candidatus Limnocylindrales bacterium]